MSESERVRIKREGVEREEVRTKEEMVLPAHISASQGVTFESLKPIIPYSIHLALTSGAIYHLPSTVLC